MCKLLNNSDVSVINRLLSKRKIRTSTRVSDILFEIDVWKTGVARTIRLPRILLDRGMARFGTDRKFPLKIRFWALFIPLLADPCLFINKTCLSNRRTARLK